MPLAFAEYKATAEAFLMNTPKERTRCQIYSRVVGFLTPISQWNNGKREEFQDRKTFDPEKCPEKLEPRGQEQV